MYSKMYATYPFQLRQTLVRVLRIGLIPAIFTCHFHNEL